jgi:hypothetical protein
MSSKTKKNNQSSISKIASHYSKTKKNIVKAAAVTTVVLPLQFFVPGARPIINKAKKYN